jgi:hypothetical protein
MLDSIMQLAPPREIAEDQIRSIASETLRKTKGRTSTGQAPKGEMRAYGRVIGVEHYDLSDPLAEAKRDILWVLLGPRLDIVEPVVATVARRDNLSGYMQDILRDRLREILEQKVMADPPQGLDLDRVVNEGTSAVAWAKAVLEKSAHPTTVNRLKYGAHKGAIPITKETEPLLPPTFIPENMEFDALVDDITGDVKYQRPRTRIKVAADTLREAYQLPILETSPSIEIRERIISALEKDMQLAHIALQYRIEIGDTIVDGADIDESLIQVPFEAVFAWMWYSQFQAQRLFELDPLVAHIVLLDALSPDPRPGREHIRKVKSILRLASSKPGWLGTIFPAYEAFLDSRYELENERSSAGPREAVEADVYEEAMRKVIAFPGNPLRVGTMGELDAKLYRLTNGDDSTPA